MKLTTQPYLVLRLRTSEAEPLSLPNNFITCTDTASLSLLISVSIALYLNLFLRLCFLLFTARVSTKQCPVLPVQCHCMIQVQYVPLTLLDGQNCSLVRCCSHSLRNTAHTKRYDSRLLQQLCRTFRRTLLPLSSRVKKCQNNSACITWLLAR